MDRDFAKIEWDNSTKKECANVARLARIEDLNLPHGRDLTTASLVTTDQYGQAAFVAREEMVVAGLSAATVVANEYGDDLQFKPLVSDGSLVERGTQLAEVRGRAARLLAAERVMLNFISRLCGIATFTREYVRAIEGTNARIYDTRKTTPAWRRLEKYAVACGGGSNHRTGLFDAILIKDNHLAFGKSGDGESNFTLAMAVRRAKSFLAESDSDAIVEVEVDTVEQLKSVLPERPDIVLLDNMTTDTLRQAVSLRAELAPEVELDASGGITLDNVRDVATTGVERISIGALTHAARWVDVGLDWLN